MVRRLLAVAAAATVVAAAPAHAAPARTGSAVIGAPYTWDGAPITGVGTDPDAVCALPGACDDTLVNIAAGDVRIAIGDAGGGAVDLDLYVYAADASGAPQTLIASDADGDANETVTFGAPAAAAYVVRVVAATALQGTYKGTATVTAGTTPTTAAGGVKPSTGPTAPGAPPPPPQQVVVKDPDPTVEAGAGGGSTTVNRAPSTKVTATSARELRGTAADSDGTVARVQVALVRLGSGSRPCTQLRSAAPTFTALKSCTAPTRYLTASGRLSWSLKLARALPKGRYVVYVRATDRKGLRQATATRRAFTLR